MATSNTAVRAVVNVAAPQLITFTVTAVHDDGAQWGWPGQRVIRYEGSDGSWAWCPGNERVGDTWTEESDSTQPGESDRIADLQAELIRAQSEAHALRQSRDDFAERLCAAEEHNRCAAHDQQAEVTRLTAERDAARHALVTASRDLGLVTIERDAMLAELRLFFDYGYDRRRCGDLLTKLNGKVRS